MFGDNLKECRLKKNINQRELAEMLGVSKGTVSSWEIGRTEPNMGMIENIAKMLDVTKSELLGEEPIPPSYIAVDNTEKILLDMVRKMDNNSANKLFLYALDLLKQGGD